MRERYKLARRQGKNGGGRRARGVREERMDGEKEGVKEGGKKVEGKANDSLMKGLLIAATFHQSQCSRNQSMV